VRKIAVLISTSLGVGTMAVLATVGEFSLLLSGILGIVTAGAAFYAIPSLKESPRLVDDTAHFSSAKLGATDTSDREIAQLDLMISQVPESSIKMTITSILHLAKQLQSAPSKDPRDEIDLHSFFNHYLPATVTICSRYLELSQQSYQTEELQETLNKTEQTLQRIESAFHKQLSNLLQNDILDLNVEVSVLEHSLRLDGLVEDKSNSKDHL